MCGGKTLNDILSQIFQCFGILGARRLSFVFLDYGAQEFVDFGLLEAQI